MLLVCHPKKILIYQNVVELATAFRMYITHVGLGSGVVCSVSVRQAGTENVVVQWCMRYKRNERFCVHVLIYVVCTKFYD